MSEEKNVETINGAFIFSIIVMVLCVIPVCITVHETFRVYYEHKEALEEINARRNQ